MRPLPIALGLKMWKMGIKDITISPLPMCDTYFGTRAQKFSTLLVVIDAVPMYDSGVLPRLKQYTSM